MFTNPPIKLITMEYPPTRGGAGVYCEELAHSAKRLGYNIEVWAPLGSQSDSSVNVKELPMKGSQDWACSWKIKKFLASQKLEDITLHIADPGALRAMIRFGWSLPKPLKLIITLHGSEIPKFSKNPIEIRFFRNLLLRADKIHVLSSYNFKSLVKLCPEVEDKIFLNAGAPARAILPSSKSSGVRNYKKDDITLLSVGRIHPRKGQLELLETISRLPNHLKERLSCHLVGPYKKAGYARKVINKSRSIGCEVQFLGDLSNSDLKNAYQKADIFALTSKPMPNSVEGFGFVYLEASAHGLPILAHHVGGVEDAVQHGKTGILCDPSGPDDLLTNLRKLIDSPEARETLGKSGLNWAAKHNWQNVANKLYNPS